MRASFGGLRSALVIVVAALVLTACGGVATGAGPSPIPTPSAGNGLGFDVVVTDKDHIATVQVGQKIELVLRAAGGMTNWTSVHSSDTSVLTPIPNPGATAMRGVTLAAFKAVAPGQAQVTAVAGADCSSGLACPMFAAVYSVTVTVNL